MNRGWTLIEVLIVVAIVGIIAAVVLQTACARPDDSDINARIQALQSKGVNVDAVYQELRSQEAKFALFRSYHRADDMLSALERGQPLPVTAPTQAFGTMKCMEDSLAVCYCSGQGISCIRK